MKTHIVKIENRYPYIGSEDDCMRFMERVQTGTVEKLEKREVKLYNS